MKRNIIFFATISILLLSLLALLPAEKTSDKTFKGRVIFLTDNFIELKRGEIETILYLSENTEFISKDGTGGGKNIIEICQVAKAFYQIEGGKNILNKIVVIKESDCIK